MARKVDKPVEAPAPDTGAGDLATLHPDVTQTIGGRLVTVRAYRFVPGMRVRAKAQPLIKALQAQIQSGSALTEEIIDVLATHDELVRELILDAIVDVPDVTAREDWAAWLGNLGEQDGELLLLIWWGVCGPFFLKTIVRRWQQARQLQQDMVALSGGPTSTPASPLPDTAPPASSGTTTPSAS